MDVHTLSLGHSATPTCNKASILGGRNVIFASPITISISISLIVSDTFFGFMLSFLSGWLLQFYQSSRVASPSREGGAGYARQSWKQKHLIW